MGSWSVSCGISKIAITAGQRCGIIPLRPVKGEYAQYLPATLPIFGQYNDYGGLEDIEQDVNVDLLETYSGITIDTLVEFLVDGKFTYNRYETKPTRRKLEENGRLDEIGSWRFMWVDRQVYETMSQNYDRFACGKHDFGTPEMLSLFGFELSVGSEITNYDPKRFNRKFRHGNVFVYSDGTCLLAEKGQYIYYLDNKLSPENSLSTYIPIPDNLKYIGEKTSAELWWVHSPRNCFEHLAPIFGLHYMDMQFDIMELAAKNNDPIPDSLRTKLIFANQYFQNIDTFDDFIVKLVHVKSNMFSMSTPFEPFELYQTPQCGDYPVHQILLERFVEINRSYLQDQDEDS